LALPTFGREAPAEDEDADYLVASDDGSIDAKLKMRIIIIIISSKDHSITARQRNIA